MLHRLHPDPAALHDADELSATLRGDRSRQGRPWLLTNMVASIDGGTSVDGVSGALGRGGDRLMFAAIRALADVVLVAAGTARAEDYRPPTADAELRARRRSHGVAETLRVAIVTRSADLDPTARLFADPANRPLVLTSERAPTDRRHALGEVADVMVVGDEGVTPAAALDALHSTGVNVVLSEGGPIWNGQLVEADVVDETFTTVAPTVLGGGTARWAHAETTPTLHDLELVQVLRSDDDEVFLHHRRAG